MQQTLTPLEQFEALKQEYADAEQVFEAFLLEQFDSSIDPRYKIHDTLMFAMNMAKMQLTRLADSSLEVTVAQIREMECLSLVVKAGMIRRAYQTFGVDLDETRLPH